MKSRPGEPPWSQSLPRTGAEDSLPNCATCREEVGWIAFSIEVGGESAVFCQRCAKKIMDAIMNKLFFKNFTRQGAL